MDRGEKGLPYGGVDGDSVVAAMVLFQTVERKRPEREVIVLLFPSVMRCFFSLFLLFPLSTMFFPLCSGFVEVLAAAAWGVAWTVVDLSSSSSLCFSSALFSSVSVLFFCFSQCCYRLGGQ
jgi:hypothetical protein